MYCTEFPGHGVALRSWARSVVPSVAGRQRCKPECNNADFGKGDRPSRIMAQFGRASFVEWQLYGEEGGDGWLYRDARTSAYVYQDFRTAIVGKFRGDTLVRGRSAEVTGYRYD